MAGKEGGDDGDNLAHATMVTVGSVASRADPAARAWPRLPLASDAAVRHKLSVRWSLVILGGFAACAGAAELAPPASPVAIRWLPWRDGCLGLRESAGPAVLAPRSLVATDAVSLAALRRQLGRHADLVPSDWSCAGRHIVVVLVPGADGGGPVMVTSLEEEGVEVLILALAAREPGSAATGGFAIALAIPEPALPVAIVLRWPAARGETTVVVLPEQPPAVRSAAGR